MFHILQDRRYGELLAELNSAASDFASNARIVCGSVRVPRMASPSERSAGAFELDSTDDNRADRRWRTWYFNLPPPRKDESCDPFGFQVVCEQRRKWKMFLAPQVRLEFLNLPDKSAIASWEQALTSRGVPYTVSSIVER
ncbi:MAG TPA: hypothetical protein VM222_00200 [Planctomycetota bacterium]|nr:hypothetical protein [Planctomycetota bacterium]